MYCFLNARGYTVLPPDEVKIDFKAIHDPIVKSVKRPQKQVFELEKAELPHALTCVLNEMVFVHVVRKPNKEQAFLLVARPESDVIKKAQLNLLLEKATKLAHTLIILNLISAQAKTLMVSFNSSERAFVGELLLKSDVIADKLRSKLVSRYQILNESEIKDLEKKYQKERKDFPWMYEQDAIARHHGFVRGMVVKEVLHKDIQYRFIMENAA